MNSRFSSLIQQEKITHVIIFLFLLLGHYSLLSAQKKSRKPNSVVVNIPSGTIYADTAKVIFANPQIETVVRKACLKMNGVLTYGDVKNIDSLDLSRKNIAALNGLEYLTNLQTLNLSTNAVTNIAPIEKLVRLKTLGLSGNLLTDKSSVSVISKLVKLKKLFLDYVVIEDSAHLLSVLKDLEELSVNDCGLDNIDFLKKAVHLKILHARNNQIKNILPVENCKDLTVLDVQRNPIDSLTALTQLKKLEVIDVSNTNIGDLKPLIKNVGLMSLDISNTHVTQLNYLSVFKQLSNLFMTNLKVPDGDIKYLKFQCPKVFIIK